MNKTTVKSITMKEAINIILEHYKGDVTKISRMKDENKVLVSFRYGTKKEVCYTELCQMYLANQKAKSLQDFFIDDNFTGTVSSIDVEGKRTKYSFYLKRNNVPCIYSYFYSPTSLPSNEIKQRIRLLFILQEIPHYENVDPYTIE
jgi:hypothetical protein